MSDQKHRDDEAADVTEENPVLSEAAETTAETPVVTLEAEHIGTRDSEAPTKMVALLDPEEDTRREVPPPLPEAAPGARTRRRSDPPLGSPDRGSRGISGQWSGTKTVLQVTLSGLGLHTSGDRAAAEAAYLGGLIDLLGGNQLRTTGGWVFAVASSVKAARAAFELLDRLQAEGASLPPERQVTARFGLARGHLGDDPEDPATAERSAAFRTAVTLGSGAEAGELLATSEVIEDLGPEGLRAQRVGKRSVEGLDELVVVHRLLHVDPTLALPLASPAKVAPAQAPTAEPGRSQTLRIALGAILLIGLGILIGYFLR